MNWKIWVSYVKIIVKKFHEKINILDTVKTTSKFTN